MLMRICSLFIGLTLLLAACSGEPSQLDLLQENPMASPTISFAEPTTVDAVHIQPGDDGYVFSLGAPDPGPSVVVHFESIAPELLDQGREELVEQAEAAGFDLEPVDGENLGFDPINDAPDVDAQVWGGSNLQRVHLSVWVFDDSIAVRLVGPNSHDPLAPGPPTGLDVLRTHPLARPHVTSILANPTRFEEGDSANGDIAPSQGPSLYTLFRVPEPESIFRREGFQFEQAVEELLEQARSTGFEPEEVLNPADVQTNSIFGTVATRVWTDTNDEGLTFYLWVVDETALIVELGATPDASFITKTLAEPGNS